MGLAHVLHARCARRRPVRLRSKEIEMNARVVRAFVAALGVVLVAAVSACVVNPRPNTQPSPMVVRPGPIYLP
jgi:hypothetical protein